MSKNLYKRGEIWWAEKIHKGTRYRFSLETSSFREAQTRFARKLEELKATQWGEKPKRTFDEALEKFVDEHFAHLKPNSIKRYGVSLKWLCEAFEGKKLEDITSGPLYEFEQVRSSAGASAPTIRRDLSCLSAMFSCAEEWEWVTHNPIPAYMRSRKKKGLKESPPRTRYLSHAEEELLIDVSPRHLQEAIIFAIDTGLREEEQFSLLRSNLDRDKNEITVTADVAKNNKERVVPILPRTCAMLGARPVNLRSPYLFTSVRGGRYSEKSGTIWRQLQVAAKRAGIEDLQWHDLRRTAGCRFLQDYGMSMERVCKWLGHSSITVTERIYAFLEVAHLHDAVKDGPTTKSPHGVVEFPRKSKGGNGL